MSHVLVTSAVALHGIGVDGIAALPDKVLLRDVFLLLEIAEKRLIAKQQCTPELIKPKCC